MCYGGVDPKFMLADLNRSIKAGQQASAQVEARPIWAVARVTELAGKVMARLGAPWRGAAAEEAQVAMDGGRD